MLAVIAIDVRRQLDGIAMTKRDDGKARLDQSASRRLRTLGSGQQRLRDTRLDVHVRKQNPVVACNPRIAPPL
jgi:hypothetical protein